MIVKLVSSGTLTKNYTKPTLYAVLYGSTVATFPKAIFCLASGFLALVVLSLNGIRTDPEKQYFPVDDTEAYIEQEDPELDSEEEEMI